MTRKSLFMAGVLAVFALSTASAKTYEIVLSTPTKAGNVLLKAGEYTLKLAGSKATFIQVDSDKSFTVDVKVENADKKFDETRIDSTKEGDTSVITDIQLGGSTTKLEFTK